MVERFDPVKDKTAQIIEYIMASPDMPEDEGVLFKIRLSVEEAVENIVQYAYPQGQGYLIVSVDRNGNTLKITFKDEGIQFNPLEQADPDISLSAEERNIGGLGIFLCKQLMDNVSYEYDKKCNILTMEKQI